MEVNIKNGLYTKCFLVLYLSLSTHGRLTNWKTEELFTERLESLNTWQIAQNPKLFPDIVIKTILFDPSKAMKFI